MEKKSKLSLLSASIFFTRIPVVMKLAHQGLVLLLAGGNSAGARNGEGCVPTESLPEQTCSSIPVLGIWEHLSSDASIDLSNSVGPPGLWGARKPVQPVIIHYLPVSSWSFPLPVLALSFIWWLWTMRFTLNAWNVVCFLTDCILSQRKCLQLCMNLLRKKTNHTFLLSGCIMMNQLEPIKKDRRVGLWISRFISAPGAVQRPPDWECATGRGPGCARASVSPCTSWAFFISKHEGIDFGVRQGPLLIRCLPLLSQIAGVLVTKYFMKTLKAARDKWDSTASGRVISQKNHRFISAETTFCPLVKMERLAQGRTFGHLPN